MSDPSIHEPASSRRPRPAVAVPVVAVVVTRGETEYLATTLDALAAQRRAPAAVVVADVEPDPRVSALVRERWGAGDLPVVVVAVAGARNLGDAVRAALPQAPPVGPDGWLWLLHDDSAPEPEALEALVAAVELAPSVAVAGCKQRTWGEPSRVLEVGVTTSRFGRRMTGIDEPEVDQGQHDARDDVLAVGTAGALVRRDVWDDLGGPDPALGPFGDGLDLSRRARLARHRVVVVPGAVVRHAQAALARPVAGAVVNRPGWDARRSVQARREAFLHAQLAGVPLGLVPVVTLLAVASGVVRALGRLVTKEPHLVVAELLAPWAVLGRPDRVVRARRSARRTRRLRRRSLRPLQATWRDVVRQWRDRRLAAAEARRTRQAPSELELRELAALRSRRRAGLAVVAVVAAVTTVVALGPLVTRVLGGGRLTGGTLLLGDASLGELVATVLGDRVGTDLGHAGPTDPLLAALVPVTALVGTVGRAAALLLLGALVLAALGAWFAAGAATRSVVLRAWAALVWTAAPVLLVALSDARFGAVLAHALLPWVALGVARAVGIARVDVVESGLVGARRAPDDADTDGADDVGPADVGPADDPAARRVVAVVRTDVPVVQRAAEPSFAAAAGAGLALAAVTAGAPVLLPAALLALALVAVVAPRRRRLGWVALPALALHAPLVVEAVRGWGDGAWRVLLADPGDPVAVAGTAPVWQQTLGWPVVPPAWLDLPDVVGDVVPFVATGGVAVVALLALVRGGGRGRAVRLGWLVATVGVVTAVVTAATDAVAVTTVTADGVDRVLSAAWHGPGLSLVLVGLLVAALAGADGVRRAMAGYAFGWRQAVVALVAVVAVAGPSGTLGAWTWHVRTGDRVGPDAPTATALAVLTEDVVPAVGRQMQASDDAVRVLRLRATPTGDLAAEVLDGNGRQLTGTSRAVTGRAVVGDPAAGRLAEPDVATAELMDVVARLGAGGSDTVAADLARLGVGAVLVPPADDDGGAARTALVGRLDSTLALERMTETGAGVIWRVAAGEVGTTAAWARLREAEQGVAGELVSTVPSQDRAVDVRIPAGTGDRQLVLADRADPAWHATLDGRPLRAVETDWRQTFELGPDGGRLEVRHERADREPWLWLQGAVLLVSVLLAVPVRRRRGAAR